MEQQQSAAEQPAPSKSPRRLLLDDAGGQEQTAVLVDQEWNSIITDALHEYVMTVLLFMDHNDVPCDAELLGDWMERVHALLRSPHANLHDICVLMTEGSGLRIDI